MSSIVVPCICIAACYIRIFTFANQAKSKVSPNQTESKPKSSDFRKSLRIAKGLFASFMLFTLCWLPYGAVVMFDFADKLPRTAHMYTMLVAHLNSALNPMLYAMFNPAYQRGYKNLLHILFLRGSSNSKHFISKTQLSTVE